MSFDTEKLIAGREPCAVVEIDLDVCDLVYGAGACTASGASGSECYNTYKTCQDTANYSKATRTIRFWPELSSVPKGEEGFPALVKDPVIAPTKLTPNDGLGYRGEVSAVLQDFPHHDRGLDPYASTRSYSAIDQGTFFGKLLARNPYYNSRLMRIRIGYLATPFAWSNFEDRVYVIDKIDGPDQKGQVKIVGKDILKLADDKTAQAPALTEGVLSADIAIDATSLVLDAGSGVDYDTDPYTGNAISATYPGYILIGDEIIKYEGVSTDTLTTLTHAQFGTEADTHDAEDSIQQCLFYDAVNCVDVIDHLLKTYAGLPEAYIPYDAGLVTPTTTNDEWDDELENWLSSNTLTRIITEPTGVNKLLGELTEQNMIFLWWNEIDQEVKLKAIAPVLKNASPLTITDAGHLIKDSLIIKDWPAGRISRVEIHYDRVNATGEDKIENYRYTALSVDTDTENDNAYKPRTLTIFANWLDASNSILIATLASRLLAKYSVTPRKIRFLLDAKDASFWTGNEAILNSRQLQGADGANELQKILVTSVKERKPGHEYEYEAISTVYSVILYGFIGPDTLNAYTAESDANRQAHGFIADTTTEKMSNGDGAYLIA